MELEDRVDKLEREMEVLKTEVQRTLLAVQESLERKSAGPSRSRWQKRAWVLALLNMLIAIILFTNIRFYALGGAPFDMGPTLGSWLRAFWVALAFLWMILQMYPLALLLEQEEQPLHGVALRNAVKLLTANPGYTILLTLLVLIVAVISSFFPVLWFVVILALLVVVYNKAVRHLLEVRRQARTEKGDQKRPSDEEGQGASVR